ncbi:hypothetical protein [Aeromonas salmonicida]|uniref:hypothetical protein n=1 Tax=Aeromonas salmonicida TaxID=645 RepID=UPI003D0705D0
MIDLGATMTEHKYPRLKQSIVLFDINPGTRQISLPPGEYRIAVVGAGAGFTKGGGGGGYDQVMLSVAVDTVYAYTVGESAAPIGGTSSFAGILSATGGQNTAGGSGFSTAGQRGGTGFSASAAGAFSIGGAAGHAFGPGASATESNEGSAFAAAPGFSETNRGVYRGESFVDGWELGLLPSDYGFGAAVFSNGIYIPAGLGGGGVGGVTPGVGGGAGQGARGGHGAVIVERIG